MKKGIARIFCLLLCLPMALSCFAAETTVEEGDGDTDFGVYARYADKETDSVEVVLKNGEAEVTLPDGTVLHVTQADKNAVQLVCVRILDEAAIHWATQALSGQGTKPVLYEIYFLDADGNRMPASNAEIALKPASSFTAPLLFSLTSGSVLTACSLNVTDGWLCFQTDGSPYYVLAEKITVPTPPQTGDASNPVLWTALLLLGTIGVSITVMLLCMRKKKQSNG